MPKVFAPPLGNLPQRIANRLDLGLSSENPPKIFWNRGSAHPTAPCYRIRGPKPLPVTGIGSPTGLGCSMRRFRPRNGAIRSRKMNTMNTVNTIVL